MRESILITGAGPNGITGRRIKEYEIFLGKRLDINWGGKAYKSREVMKPSYKFPKIPNFDINHLLFSDMGNRGDIKWIYSSGISRAERRTA